MKSIVSFKISGMFSGRSETLKINAFSPQGDELKLFAEGTWIEEMHLSNGKTIWKAGSLVKNFANKYGFTEFAASLNEITKIESDKVAPTDSRLRPDQRAYENGDIDTAEDLKIKLEEDQRKRRKDSNGNPTVHEPAFFKMENGDELKWKYISGEKSYWNRRKNGEWDGLVKLWE
ncbi:unnamed protein product [[Candida] boidinii]|nr:unnamed protein product [[Candida] boidinii]